MTDYSKLSDEQIAKLVGDVLKLEWANLNDNYNGLCCWKNGDLWVFNPCNNPADAWPIIVDNGISLECIIVNRYEKTWRAQFKPAYVKHHMNHKNPLRAAMIVFLQMQENKQ